jgi:hypothetical protein
MNRAFDGFKLMDDSWHWWAAQVAHDMCPMSCCFELSSNESRIKAFPQGRMRQTSCPFPFRLDRS